jgi:hypothetical protein
MPTIASQFVRLTSLWPLRAGGSMGPTLPRAVQALAGIGYAFGWGEVMAAWRYLDYELPGDGPVSDLNFNGPLVGASFAW